MDSELFLNLKNLSFEIIVIGIVVFALTMLIKLPIKKLTAKFTEEKRKLINSIILIIPAVLSLVLSVFESGIFKHLWISLDILEMTFSSWVLSLTIYAILDRTLIIIKGIKAGTIKVDESLTKETISYVKDSIKTATKLIKENEKEIEKIDKKKKSLQELKTILESNDRLRDLTKISETNIEIEKLNNQIKELEKINSEAQNEIENYNLMLYPVEGNK